MSSSSQRIVPGGKAPIGYHALDSDSDAVTGFGTLGCEIRRTSDNFVFDWDDDTFKNSGWTTAQVPLTEVGSTGYYRLDETNHDEGFDTSAITNAIVGGEDTYIVRLFDSVDSDTIANIPAVGEIVTDVEKTDVAAILVDTAAIDARLPSDPADESLQQAAHTATQADVAAVKGVVDAVLVDTDAMDTRLPSDPADESLQQAAHTTTQADIAAAKAVVDAILVDTDAIDTRLPSDPADESLQQASHTATKAVVDAILVDTDAIDTRLPTDPADESLQQAAHTATQADIAAAKVVVDAILVDTAAMDGRLPSDPADESLQQAAHAVTQAAVAAVQVVVDATKVVADAILVDTAAMEGRLPSDPADESLQQAAHAVTQAAIAALNDLSSANVAAAILSDSTPFAGADVTLAKELLAGGRAVSESGSGTMTRTKQDGSPLGSQTVRDKSGGAIAVSDGTGAIVGPLVEV